MKPWNEAFSNDLVLLSEEVAELLKVSVSTVEKLAVSQSLPAFRIANEWRFRPRDVEIWIHSQVHAAHCSKDGKAWDRDEGNKQLNELDPLIP